MQTLINTVNRLCLQGVPANKHWLENLADSRTKAKLNVINKTACHYAPSLRLRVLYKPYQGDESRQTHRGALSPVAQSHSDESAPVSPAAVQITTLNTQLVVCNTHAHMSGQRLQPILRPQTDLNLPLLCCFPH